MYTILKATEKVGGSLAYRDGLLDKVYTDLASQLNDKKVGVINVVSVSLNISETDIHAVALVEVEEPKKKK